MENQAPFRSRAANISVNRSASSHREPTLAAAFSYFRSSKTAESAKRPMEIVAFSASLYANLDREYFTELQPNRASRESSRVVEKSGDKVPRDRRRKTRPVADTVFSDCHVDCHDCRSFCSFTKKPVDSRLLYLILGVNFFKSEHCFSLAACAYGRQYFNCIIYNFSQVKINPIKTCHEDMYFRKLQEKMFSKFETRIPP